MRHQIRTKWRRGRGAWGPVREREEGAYALSVWVLPSDYPGQRATQFEWTVHGPGDERRAGTTHGVAETVDRIRWAQEAADAALRQMMKEVTA